MYEAVILAAGKGTRMCSNLPKVLHPIAGKSMLQHVLDAVTPLNLFAPAKIVVGHGRDIIKRSLTETPVELVVQEMQQGTGHAALQALPLLNESSITLILYGDVPLISTATLEKLGQLASNNTMGLLTVSLTEPTGYGRIVRTAAGEITAIVEHKDANEQQRKICEVNTGIMAVKTQHLQRWLPALNNNNAQNEFYLTDIVAMAQRDGIEVKACQPETADEVQGVNDRAQQASVERAYQRKQAQKLMAQGVSFADPDRFDCRGSLTVGRDVFIDINVVIEGTVSIADGVTIGPNCCIKNSNISANTAIKAYSHIEGASVADSCDIGPFARLRPGTELQAGVKIGNFVELKKSVIGVGSKVNHLSYIGDCSMGPGVNVGAGTITCNYDGVNKFQTTIGESVFIGSNSALVAPLNIAAGTTVAAGSVITQNTEKEDLAVARSRQRNIKGWSKPQKH
ncbi:bifunctional UDP-N-acetylglucosamine diphosphorylase/glucosamine-1-phosphate N-acetyltransferase GlmU [Gilvimarinus polysaccharolyticus]|uniref:bifunctional UDP-N-acetylglucosamine diphosphorylase/glucosamine-1-phosphate N-acetyltransferase GlmU n=1 Tax=Gilvimarinus polysaccharolyticus TaxID=863921 RepID=UPI000673315E|nr:bifunctional UDP-N-acetylglucosamine diphosphorylase/glucosamine-1-phosphate N-acetyltransferase GlmU [Gilvimarinus polysaccharolyticus]